MSDLFDGVRIISPSDVGRFSPLQRIAITGGPDVLEDFDLSDAELLVLHYCAEFSARPIQVPDLEQPGWSIYFFCGGRGAGKTWAGAFSVVQEAMQDPDARILVVGPSYSEIVSVQIEGPSGILSLCPPWFQPVYRKARRELRFPNGAMVKWFPAQNPDKFRGFAASYAWADELVAWKREPIEVYNEIFRVLRVETPRMRRCGIGPRAMLTTTPKPLPIFRHMLERDRERMILARSPTWDNADNLAPDAIRYARRIMHTTEGQRENGGVLSFGDLDAAIFANVDWDKWRVEAAPERFDLVVVSLDPATGQATGADKRRDSTGLVVVGFRQEADDFRHAYVLAARDYKVGTDSTVWAKDAVELCRAWSSRADDARIISESNAGGRLVMDLLRQFDGDVPIKMTLAKDSKDERARVWAPAAETGLVHIVGKIPKLESQLKKFAGGGVGTHASDDLLDACSWPMKLYLVPTLRGSLPLGEETQEAA